jgi:hypothetical protein
MDGDGEVMELYNTGFMIKRAELPVVSSVAGLGLTASSSTAGGNGISFTAEDSSPDTTNKAMKVDMRRSFCPRWSFFKCK